MSHLRFLGTHRVLTWAAGVAVATPVVAWVSFSAISHGVFHRSNLSTASEIYFRNTHNRQRLSDAVTFDNYVLRRAETNEEPPNIPEPLALKTSLETDEVGGVSTVRLNRRDRNDRAVLYLHGGNFLRRPNLYEWKFADSVARRTRAELFMPWYPLAPNHSCLEAHEALENVYRAVVAEYGARNVTLMGDGAGGGLAAALAQRLPTLGLEQPARLILISPWVDVTLHNPLVEEYEASDPLLAAYGLRRVGKLWTRGMDENDPRACPVNGEVRSLRNVLVFAGTRELLYPDAKLFFDRVAATGVHADFFEGRGLNHSFPLYPTPEASRALNAIVNAVTED